jgi:hypothetical protein
MLVGLIRDWATIDRAVIVTKKVMDKTRFDLNVIFMEAFYRYQ